MNAWLNRDDWNETWDWYTNESNEFIYHNIDDIKWERQLRHENSQHMYYTKLLSFNQCPDDVIYKVSVLQGDRSIILLNTSFFANASTLDETNSIVFDQVAIK